MTTRLAYACMAEDCQWRIDGPADRAAMLEALLVGHAEASGHFGDPHEEAFEEESEQDFVQWFRCCADGCSWTHEAGVEPTAEDLAAIAAHDDDCEAHDVEYGLAWRPTT